MNLICDPPVWMMELKDFADLAWAFMTGVPGRFNSGYRIMGPDELRNQRYTYVKYWTRLLNKELARVIAASRKE